MEGGSSWSCKTALEPKSKGHTLIEFGFSKLLRIGAELCKTLLWSLGVGAMMEEIGGREIVVGVREDDKCGFIAA